MDWMKQSGRLPELLKKYRYAILILVIGLVFMMIPGTRKDAVEAPQQTTALQEEADSVSKALAEILSNIQGAGKVEVMLTTAAGEETVYQTDDDTAGRTTVTVTDTERNQTGLVRQINPPVYLGAVIVCQGADSPSVRLAIVDAVSKVTGLGADRISVVKMK